MNQNQQEGNGLPSSPRRVLYELVLLVIIAAFMAKRYGLRPGLYGAALIALITALWLVLTEVFHHNMMRKMSVLIPACTGETTGTIVKIRWYHDLDNDLTPQTDRKTVYVDYTVRGQTFRLREVVCEKEHTLHTKDDPSRAPEYYYIPQLEGEDVIVRYDPDHPARAYIAGNRDIVFRDLHAAP